jgi:hypothetical protein
MLAWFISFFASLWYTALLAGGVVLFLVALFLKPILDGMTGGTAALVPAWVVGPLRAAGKTVGVILALYGGWNLAMQRHDAGLEATWAAAQREAVASAQLHAAIEGDRAVAAAAAEAEKRGRDSAAILERIVVNAVPSACPTPVNLADVGAELLRRGGVSGGGQDPVPGRAPGALFSPPTLP